MNFLGNITTKISGIMKNKPIPDEQTGNYENINHEDLAHTLNVLKDENKILKDKLTSLDKENKLLKNSILDTNENSNSQFGKIFNNLKTTFLLTTDLGEEDLKTQLYEFKSYLYDQMFFYGGIEEEDVEFLNGISVTDDTWNTNRDVFLFRQKLLERNYREMMKNLLASNELNRYLAQTEVVSEAKEELKPVVDKPVAEELSNKMEVEKPNQWRGSDIMGKIELEEGMIEFSNSMASKPVPIPKEAPMKTQSQSKVTSGTHQEILPFTEIKPPKASIKKEPAATKNILSSLLLNDEDIEDEAPKKAPLASTSVSKDKDSKTSLTGTLGKKPSKKVWDEEENDE